MTRALHVVADPSVFEGSERFLDAMERAARALSRHPEGVLQLRIGSFERGLLGRACERARSLGAPFVLNASVDLETALDLGAGGVHYPESRIPVRPNERAGCALLGASVHDEAALRRAERAGVGYVIFGPVFDAFSAKKPGVGLAALDRIARATSLPVVAIGGMTPARVAACLEAGAAGVATLSGILAAPDPAAAVEGFVAALAAPPVARSRD
jgi:thiamine-phosphate diphosphorylase